MSAMRRRRSIAIAVGSGTAHALVLTLIAMHAPRLLIPAIESGPPQAIIPILIVPRVPSPATAAGTRPTEIRLHRRPQRAVDIPTDVKPLITPRPEARRPALPEDPANGAPASQPEPLTVNARTALRGRVGCANAAAVGLTRAEREACEDQFAAGASSAAFRGLGLERGKADALGRAGARREADFRYKRGLPGPPVAVPVGAGWDEQRSPPKGASNLGMGAAPHDLGAEPLKVPF